MYLSMYCLLLSRTLSYSLARSLSLSLSLYISYTFKQKCAHIHMNTCTYVRISDAAEEARAAIAALVPLSDATFKYIQLAVTKQPREEISLDKTGTLEVRRLVCVCVCFFLSIDRSFYPSIHPSVCLSVCLSV